MPTLAELVAAKRFVEEVDGMIRYVYHHGPGGGLDSQAEAAWQIQKLEEAGIDYVAPTRKAAWDKENPDREYVWMIYVGPFTLRPRTDARGCVPAELLKAAACVSAQIGQEPRVTVWHAEWLWGDVLGIKDHESDFDEDTGQLICKWSETARSICDDVISTINALRDPRQRSKPGWAGCGHRSGPPGPLDPYPGGHKTAADLDVSMPLRPTTPSLRSEDWDTIYYLKEY